MIKCPTINVFFSAEKNTQVGPTHTHPQTPSPRQLLLSFSSINHNTSHLAHAERKKKTAEPRHQPHFSAFRLPHFHLHLSEKRTPFVRFLEKFAWIRTTNNPFPLYIHRQLTILPPPLQSPFYLFIFYVIC